MLKKTITYTDYNDVTRTEDYYFHMSQPELIDLNNEVKGGMVGLIQGIINTEDQNGILTILKDLILRSYGIKSEDGKRFIKTENGRRLRDEFEESEAFVTLYMELATSDEAAADFINGVVPKKLLEEAEKMKNSTNA